MVIRRADNHLTQLVCDARIVCLDRRRNITLDEAGVVEKFGVSPSSIPDYLALVGDSADGIPGIPRWGAKTSARVLKLYPHIEQIPGDPSQWDLELRGAQGIAASLGEHMEEALLYRTLATLRLDVPLMEDLADLQWHRAVRGEFSALCDELGFPGLVDLPHRWDER